MIMNLAINHYKKAVKYEPTDKTVAFLNVVQEKVGVLGISVRAVVLDGGNMNEN